MRHLRPLPLLLARLLLAPLLLAPLLLAPLLLLAACGEPERPAAQAPAGRAVPEVWTTFYPTTYLAERLGGPLVKVVCPLPPDEDPAFWRPDAAVVQGYQEADLIVINGAGFERFVDKVSLPTARVVDVSRGFSDRFLRLTGATTHSHGGGAAHTHEGLDGHTWFDPLNLKEQALALARALQRRLPAHAAAIEANLAALSADLDALDAAFRALGRLPEGLSLYGAHPAWNYAAQRYGWSMVNFHLDPGEVPPEEEWARLRESLKTKPARHLLWEDTPLPAVAERLQQELGLTSLTVPPCESESPEDRAQKRDLLVRMRANVEALRPAFAPR